LAGKITLRDIGRKLNLSSTTISLALRDHPRISAGTKERIRKLITEWKYEPDQVARALVMGRSNLIGVIVPNSSDPYYAEIFKGIEDGVRSANCYALLCNGSYDLDGYAARVKEMMSLRVGGILIAPPFKQERLIPQPFWEELRHQNTPVVLINRRLNPAVFHQVSADYESGVRMVVETLASLGHRRVAYISGEPALLPIQQRLAAFRRLARKHGFDEDPSLLGRSLLTLGGGYDACERMWSGASKKPSAMVTFSDSIAVGVLRFLLEKNIDVPEDVSLISFDGIAFSEYTNPSISTVVTPMYEIGQKAFSLLQGTLNGDHKEPQNVVLPVKLVVRESVCRVRATQESAARAGQSVD
jgi:LacI family transcriptional regulator